MKKLVEVLIVEDFSGNRVSQKDIDDLVNKLKDNSNIIVNRIHLPFWEGDEGLLGMHVVVRDVAET